MRDLRARSPNDVTGGPAVDVVRLAKQHAHEATNLTAQHQFDAVTHRALSLVVCGGFRFERDDASQIARLLGVDAFDRYHQRACEAGNTSAAISFERHAGRKPCWHPVTGKRMHLESTFPWDGHEAELTSFADDKTIIACAFDKSRHEYGRKVVRRWRIPIAELTKPGKNKEEVSK